MDFKEFRTELCNKRGPKKRKITNCWGVYDCYKAIRKHKWFNIGRPLKSAEFYAIIRSVNKYLANNISNGIEVKFPLQMGVIELRKMHSGAFIKEGKLKNTYPVDWAATHKLWYEDEEARKEKILVRNEQPIVYRVKYNKIKARYENKQFYKFELNRFAKIALKNNIQQGKVDTLW